MKEVFINPRKLEIYGGITKILEGYDIKIPCCKHIPHLTTRYERAGSLYTIYGKYGPIYTLSRPPFNQKAIAHPLISCTGEYCLTSEDLDYFRELKYESEVGLGSTIDKIEYILPDGYKKL